jgi:hypothetical protein
MKTNTPDKSNLFEGGRDEFEGTNEYNNKVNEIIKEVTDKYSSTLSDERHWVRRLLIKLKLKLEITKRIQALSSSKNLHVIGR